MQNTAGNHRTSASVLLVALVSGAWFGAACSSRKTPPNLPPPEYEAPRELVLPAVSNQVAPTPEPSSAPSPTLQAPAVSASAAAVPEPGDSGSEAR